jgi:hypothetical protein
MTIWDSSEKGREISNICNIIGIYFTKDLLSIPKTIIRIH